MKWFFRWADRRVLNTERKEMEAFLDGLTSMDGCEIGMLVVHATHFRNMMESEGHYFMDPFMDWMRDPEIYVRLHGYIREYQRTKKLLDAAATMVWLHTARVGARHELRKPAREMWRQLSRGFPYVESAADEVLRLTGRFPRIDGYDRFPVGLTPDPI